MSAQNGISGDAVMVMLSALGDLALEFSPLGECVGVLGSLRDLPAPPGGFLGRRVEELFPQETANSALTAFEQVAADGLPRAFDYGLSVPEGIRYFEARLAQMPDGNLFTLVRDVHAPRVVVDEKVRESEARFRLMADSAPVMLWESGTDSECDFFNQRWLEFTGRPLEKELGVGWAEGVHAEDFPRCMDTYLDAFAHRRPFRMEYRLRRHDGTYRWILDQGVPRVSPGGLFEGYIGSCVDVTELRDAGDEIRRLYGSIQRRLRERELLLREIHHRVKNNLQLISSLLGLNARDLESEAARQMEAGRERVRSIALIHEKLYESVDLSDVDLAEYARDLARMVLHASGTHPEIEVRVQGHDVRLGVDQASPCGLILNELLTNALKHAFPNGRGGSVIIDIRRISGNRVGVTVQDDGVGLPAGVDPRHPHTLGFEVVSTLAEQLDAKLVLEGNPGTAFHLTFAVPGE